MLFGLRFLGELPSDVQTPALLGNFKVPLSREGLTLLDGGVEVPFLEALPGAGQFVPATEVRPRIEEVARGMSSRIDEPRRVGVGVEIAVQGRWVVVVS